MLSNHRTIERQPCTMLQRVQAYPNIWVLNSKFVNHALLFCYQTNPLEVISQVWKLNYRYLLDLPCGPEFTLVVTSELNNTFEMISESFLSAKWILFIADFKFNFSYSAYLRTNFWKVFKSAQSNHLSLRVR